MSLFQGLLPAFSASAQFTFSFTHEWFSFHIRVIVNISPHTIAEMNPFVNNLPINGRQKTAQTSLLSFAKMTAIPGLQACRGLDPGESRILIAAFPILMQSSILSVFQPLLVSLFS